jgi:chemotaxis protein MotB
VPEDKGGAGHVEAPIFKKVVKAGHGHHGGAWKVAYADMVTAMLALFIVLWILAQSEEVKQNVAGYFRDPVGFKEGGVPSVMPGGAAGGAPAVIDAEVIAAQAAAAAAAAERQAWNDRADRIQAALERIPVFERYRGQVELAVTPEGLRITLVESTSTPLFQVGSLALNGEAEALLEAIGQKLAETDHHIVLDGHTDSRPFAGANAVTNWELSTGRAHTARRVLETAGVAAGRFFEVRGYADRQLYNPLDPNDSRNRRIAITLLSRDAFKAKVRDGSTATLLN